MIGLTLGSYLARHMLRMTGLIFLLFLTLILAVDLIELARAVPQKAGAGIYDLFLVAVLRAPELAQNVLPFAVLFGAAASLMALNARLELVVARASGVSVWQFLLPLALSAVAIGLVAATTYNPLSLSAQTQSRALEAEIFGKVKGNFANTSSNFWLRAGQPGGDVIIRALIEQNGGRDLTGVTLYRFTLDGVLVERVDAESARFVRLPNGENGYRLQGATVTDPGQKGVERDVYDVELSLSASELRLNTTIPAAVSFWNLGEQARRAQEAGRNHLPFLTRQAALTSQSLLFVAMVLIAGAVSLRFARFGANGKLILGGILSGFVLYVASQLVLPFGRNGFVSPVMAAWAPALVGVLVGVTVLLHQEDG